MVESGEVISDYLDVFESNVMSMNVDSTLPIYIPSPASNTQTLPASSHLNSSKNSKSTPSHRSQFASVLHLHARHFTAREPFSPSYAHQLLLCVTGGMLQKPKREYKASKVRKRGTL